jgi:hypothetical protein
MDWVKRNLYFVIGSLVALALMGLAGWYLYSKWEFNNSLVGQLDEQYAKLQHCYDQKPHPGSGKIDNIQEAKEQQKQLRAYIRKACQRFQNIAPIPVPETGKLTSQQFSTALSRTIDLLQHEAREARVELPKNATGQNYSFSFEVQRPRLSFAAGSLEPLSVQLGEVKAIFEVLFAANISALDALRRERVSDDDQNGPLSDYLPDKSVTNELAVLTPYDVDFRCFSKDLAAVLSGFANSPYPLIVKSVNVDPAPEAAPTDQATPPPTQPVQIYQTVPQAPPSGPPPPEGGRPSPEAAYASRYGPAPRAAAPPPQQPQYTTVYRVAAPATANKGGLPTVLNEKQLKVTMTVVVVKLVCPK